MRWTLVFLLLGGCGGIAIDALDPALFTASPTWGHDIQPLMARSCAECHSEDGLRAGGVEVDNYQALYSARIKNACVALSPEMVARFSMSLLALGENGAHETEPCHDWEVFSMPTGALPPLTPGEQVLLGRWVQIGAPE